MLASRTAAVVEIQGVTISARLVWRRLPETQTALLLLVVDQQDAWPRNTNKRIPCNTASSGRHVQGWRYLRTCCGHISWRATDMYCSATNRTGATPPLRAIEEKRAKTTVTKTATGRGKGYPPLPPPPLCQNVGPVAEVHDGSV